MAGGYRLAELAGLDHQPFLRVDPLVADQVGDRFGDRVAGMDTDLFGRKQLTHRRGPFEKNEAKYNKTSPGHDGGGAWKQDRGAVPRLDIRVLPMYTWA